MGRMGIKTSNSALLVQKNGEYKPKKKRKVKAMKRRISDKSIVRCNPSNLMSIGPAVIGRPRKYAIKISSTALLRCGRIWTEAGY
jgi:hypothetical protein